MQINFFNEMIVNKFYDALLFLTLYYSNLNFFGVKKKLLHEINES